MFKLYVFISKEQFWPSPSDKLTIQMLSNLSKLVSEFSSHSGHCTVEVVSDNLTSSHLANELENPTSLWKRDS